MKRIVMGVAVAAAITIGSLFTYGASYSGLDVVKHPVSFATSFTIPSPLKGQTEAEYTEMIGAMAEYRDASRGQRKRLDFVNSMRFDDEVQALIKAGDVTPDFYAHLFKVQRVWAGTEQTKRYTENMAKEANRDARSIVQKLKDIP
ncbi:hypothetical protein [Pseudomonas kurunegalensis]|uniref:hypothetical protein n=1 Tax=Pseudomonas kurunegalensis TaxID=485880 RepID=UPI004029B20B